VTRIPGLAPGMTIAAARRALAQTFRTAGLDSPELDARVLIGHALGLDHAALVSNGERTLDAHEAATIAAFAGRRLKREPVARITGHKEFWGLDLSVTPATLVPRPETETVVETTLAAVADRTRPLRLADFGVGTGALLLALLSELPSATGIGTDLSEEALRTARANAERLDLAARTAFVRCDYGAALHGPFDIVVSNPPYIESNAIGGLDPEVRDYDPRLALDGGSSGLHGYRVLVSDAHRILAPAGILVVELGAGQASDVAALMEHAGLVTEPPRADLMGHFRAILARPAMRGRHPQGPK
jgi:release factor glutamine methyltransferase